MSRTPAVDPLNPEQRAAILQRGRPEASERAEQAEHELEPAAEYLPAAQTEQAAAPDTE